MPSRSALAMPRSWPNPWTAGSLAYRRWWSSPRRTDDHETHALCARPGVQLHVTRKFYENGAKFNKAGAMNEALSLVPWSNWILFFDADCVPPKTGNACFLIRPT